MRNTILENKMKDLIKKARRTPNEKAVKDATRIVDKAAKKNIIHKNKAARIKSTLSKLLVKKGPKKTAKKEGSKAPQKKKP